MRPQDHREAVHSFLEKRPPVHRNLDREPQIGPLVSAAQRDRGTASGHCHSPLAMPIRTWPAQNSFPALVAGNPNMGGVPPPIIGIGVIPTPGSAGPGGAMAPIPRVNAGRAYR